MNRTSVCIAVSLFALLALGACVPSATIIHTVPSAELEERDEDEETAAKSENTLLAEDAAAKKENDDKMQAAKARAILIGKTALNDPKSGLSFLQIPSGTFMMGCTEGDKACDRGEKPTHSVTISRPFYIAFTLTTNFQYQKCVDAGVCHGKAYMTKRANPIGNVNWIEAQEF